MPPYLAIIRCCCTDRVALGKLPSPPAVAEMNQVPRAFLRAITGRIHSPGSFESLVEPLAAALTTSSSTAQRWASISTAAGTHARQMCSTSAAQLQQQSQQHLPSSQQLSSIRTDFMERHFSTSSASGSNDRPPSEGSSSSGGSASESSSPAAADAAEGKASSLQAAMDKLVDTAVDLVEQDRLPQAVEVLQQGITLLSSTYPGSAELGELHNQAALLLLFGHQHDAAAKHASDALDITQKAFGPTHPLTGHRLLRLGTIRFAAGQLEQARPLLATAADMLATQLGDPSLAEALFYMNLYSLTSAASPAAVATVTPPLKENFKQLVQALGGDSMIVRLALAAHSKLVGTMLDMGLPQGEAAFKQHIGLQEIQDPESAELGLTLYQLATTYYAHDMLVDAGPVLQRATQLMRGHFPEEHDLVVLCKHRMGMICAAGRDHRAATALLNSTKEHYQKLQQEHPLALEADVGLTMASVKALEPRLSAAERTAAVDEALEQMRRSITGMASALGTEHLLVSAATRYLAQLSVMMGQQR